MFFRLCFLIRPIVHNSPCRLLFRVCSTMDEGTSTTLSDFKDTGLKRSAEKLQGPESAKRPRLASHESASESHKLASSDPKEDKEGKKDSPKDQKLRRGKNKSEKNKGRR